MQVRPPADQNPPRASRASALGLLAVATALSSLGGRCAPGPSGSLSVTLNAIPDAYKELLVVPASGFTVDVTYGQSTSVLPSTLTLLAFPLAGGDPVDLTSAIAVSDGQGAAALVPSSQALPVGSHFLVTSVETTSGGTVWDALDFAVREHPAGGPPLEQLQWVLLDFEADPDGDLQPDFPDDLAGFGLASLVDPPLDDLVRAWVIAEVTSRAQAFYSTPNPSQLPGGDAANIAFTTLAPPPPYTRICVGGEDPTGGTTAGNVLFDPGNSNLADVACDTFLPSGIYPRELLWFGSDPLFQGVFDGLIASPVGTHPLDAVVLGPGYDPGDPAQSARFQQIQSGVESFAQMVATLVAHETGHAIGLVPSGPPGGGLYGGGAGAESTHNVTLAGTTPAENYLMNKGQSFGFEDLTGLGGASLPVLRELNFAYLRGRLVLDAAVTGIFPPPTLSLGAPTQISLSGPPLVAYTAWGQNFLDTPTLRFLGPSVYSLLSETLVSSSEVAGLVSVLQLTPGHYDLELENADGQLAVLDYAIEVVP